METSIAENIRAYRKQRGLTQEQLAEVLGVSVGAVYKWESRSSLPELRLIMEMADFFEISVDALLGYQMQDNRLQAMLERLSEYINTENPEGLNEAEKALKRFPHSFDVVYLSAILYMIFGGKNRDNDQLTRASGLLEDALILLPQNTEKKISEITIYGWMSNIRTLQGHEEQAAELLKKHNREGIFDDQIGLILSLICKRPEEAQPYLSEALLESTVRMIRTVIGKAYAFTMQGNMDSAEEILLWGIRMLEGLKQPGIAGHADQSCGYLQVMMAYVYLKKNMVQEANDAAGQALKLAQQFDDSPSFDARSYRFMDDARNPTLHEIMGRTAVESMGYIARLLDDGQMTALWERITENEHAKN